MGLASNKGKFWGRIEVWVFLAVMAFCVVSKHQAVVEGLGTNKMIDPWGDGLKTYTNAIYHIEHDSTYHWYQGMNYPYGEHIIPATELAGIAIAGKFLKQWFPNISDYIVSIMHAEMLLALLLCGLFLFLIFKDLGLPFAWSLVLAILLSFLSPLNARMHSHYGLAQPFIIPALFYFILQFHKDSRWIWSIAIALTIFISAFLHFYFFAIGVFFISGYFFFRVANEWSWQHLKAILPHYSLMVLLPLLFFLFWMILPDPVNVSAIPVISSSVKSMRSE